MTKYKDRDTSFEDVYQRQLPPAVNYGVLAKVVAIRDYQNSVDDFMNSAKGRDLIKKSKAIEKAKK